MDKKNKLDKKNNKKPSFGRIKYATLAALMTSVFSATPSYSQNGTIPTDLQKKNKIELVGNDDKEKAEVSHEKIITMNIDDVMNKYGLDKVINHMLQEINAYRKKIGTTPLSLSPEMNALAQNHAKDMAKQGYFSHENKEGDDVGDRADKANITRHGISENISNNPKNIQRTLNGYFAYGKETGHYKIFENPYKVLGCGIAKGDNGTYYLVFVYAY